MPYRHAHWFVLALFPLAAAAFWRDYLSQLTTASAAFHAHGITATLWLALLAAQSLSIQAGRRGLHRGVGVASLALFPLFLAGGMAIFIGMAQRYASAVSPFYTLYAPRLAWLDIISVAGLALFYVQALRQRRKVHAHAGYLLATAIFLVPPILGRLSAVLPFLAIAGPQDFGKLHIGFQLANAATVAIALAIAARQGRHARPWLAAAGLIALSALAFEYPGGAAWWREAYALVAQIPIGPAMALTALAGAALGWAGWTAGRPSLRAAAAAAPA